MKKMLSLMRKCLQDYDMIKDGEKIAVGVSGGKDSLTLLYVLSELSKFYEKSFTVCGITLDMGFDNADFSPIENFCKQIGVEYIVQKTNIKEVVFDIRKESNPCSLCAKLRRGALHDAALQNGCKTVALGHHFDDAVETFMLSLFYESRINCFSPVTFLDRKQITVIRPLLYIPEKKIIRFADDNKLPVAKNPCIADGATKRQEMKDLLVELESKYPGLRERMFGAIQRSYIDGWQMNDNQK